MKGRLILFALRLLSWLPLSVAQGLGGTLGRLLYWLPNPVKRVAETNLRLCFSQLKPPQRDALLKRSLIETGKTLMEMGAMWFWTPHRLRSLIKRVDGLEHLEAANARGQGVIALTPHLGQWELLGVMTPDYAPITSLYKPPRDARVDATVKAQRARSGNQLTPTTVSGVKAITRALRAGEFAGILPDQDPGSAGVFAPFFGVETNTMTLVARLAAKTGAEGIIGYARRLPAGQGFVLQFHRLEMSTLASNEPRVAAGALNRAIEDCVRECPEQYQWGYKRFKRQPENQPARY